MRLYNFLKNEYNLTKSELEDFKKLHDIRVNGEKIPLSSILKDTDSITIDGNKIEMYSHYYYLYHKPRGVLSTISSSKDSYIHQINLPHKVSPAGRLDKDSCGLMILSNDGAFLNEITGDASTMDKEYYVTLEYPITEEFLLGMQKSYYMDNRYTTPAKVKKITDHQISVILYEGLYHQVRRLVKINKNKVLELKRIRIGSYHLQDLKPNELIEIKKIKL